MYSNAHISQAFACQPIACKHASTNISLFTVKKHVNVIHSGGEIKPKLRKGCSKSTSCYEISLTFLRIKMNDLLELILYFPCYSFYFVYLFFEFPISFI